MRTIALSALGWVLVGATSGCDSGNRTGTATPGGVATPRSTPSSSPSSSGAGGGFVENAGQVENAAVRFYATARGMDVGFTQSAVLFNLREDRANEPRRGALVRVSFVGAQDVLPRGEGEQPGRHHFLRGNDPSRWRSDVHSFARIVYQDLYPGVDLVYRMAEQGAKYEFLLDAGVDPKSIRWTYEGIDALTVDDDGGLVLSTAVGELRDQAPVAVQEGAHPACAAARLGPATASFRCEGHDPALPLLIDPLVYSTFIGGSRLGGGAADARVDADGNVYLTGRIRSAVPAFPTTPGAYDITPGGSVDAFVTKLGPAGDALVFSTLLGGAVEDTMGPVEEFGGAIGLDPAGDILVAGATSAPDFPVTPGAHDALFSPFGEHYVVKLSADGSTMLWGTFLGGPEFNSPDAMAVDAEGSAYLTGGHLKRQRPLPATPGAFDETPDLESHDVYVLKLAPDGGSVVFATYLGGAGDERVRDIAVDAAGSAHVVGQTQSLEDTFPVTPGAFDVVNMGDLQFDAFVVKLSPAGDAVLWGTFLGDSQDEGAGGVAVDGMGNVYVTGATTSAGFPVTPGAMDTTLSGDSDGFVVKLASGGDKLIYSTLLGGSIEPVPNASGGDRLRRPLVDALGNLYVAGESTSLDFPTTADAFDSTHHLGADPFSHADGIVVKIDPTGSTLLYGTYLGGSGDDRAHLAGIGPGGEVYVVGNTRSSDFPTTAGAFDRVFREDVDVYVAKLDIGADEVTPPDCAAATAEPTALWPPNHGLAAVLISGVLGTIAVTGVRQDEPTDGVGDGRTCPDAAISGDGTVALRAERAGAGDGRVYHVGFTASGPGGECSGTVTVCVPHDQGDATCVDGGPAFDSLACGP